LLLLLLVRGPLLTVGLIAGLVVWTVLIPVRVARRVILHKRHPRLIDYLSYVGVCSIAIVTQSVLRPLLDPEPWPRWPSSDVRFEPRLTVLDLP
jgi:hypothetical protein